jgi:hypothetical protein
MLVSRTPEANRNRPAIQEYSSIKKWPSDNPVSAGTVDACQLRTLSANFFGLAKGMKAMSATSTGISLHAYRAAFIAAVAILVSIVSAPHAGAVNPQVRAACANDYLSNCSAFKPDSAETRKCMRAVGYRLSKGCISALVATGQVSKADIARRSANNRRD